MQRRCIPPGGQVPVQDRTHYGRKLEVDGPRDSNWTLGLEQCLPKCCHGSSFVLLAGLHFQTVNGGGDKLYFHVHSRTESCAAGSLLFCHFVASVVLLASWFVQLSFHRSCAADIFSLGALFSIEAAVTKPELQ